MHIQVIGGSGFIGSRLCRRLSAARLSWDILDKAPSAAFPEARRTCDVRTLEDLRSTIVQDAVLVNLAAEHRDDVRPVSLYDDVNVGGARNISIVARERGVQTIIFTSTVAVYGFAEPGTGESGAIAPFNAYGRTKFEAEEILREWQREDLAVRKLVIIRPTVVFGEQNRGNVYNLLNQIATGRFLMIGDGENRKSMAYVENLCAFIEHSLSFAPGVHVYNFVDKPDFTMNSLVGTARTALGREKAPLRRLPYAVGYAIAKVFDGVAMVTGRTFPVSSIRVKKFCSSSVYSTAIAGTGFVSPVPLEQALAKTIRHEFVETQQGGTVFYSE